MLEIKKGKAEAFPTIPYSSENQSINKILMVDGLGHAETGVLADIDLVEHLF